MEKELPQSSLIDRFRRKNNSKLVEGLTVFEAAKYLTGEKNGRKNDEDSFYICDLGEVVRLFEEWKVLFPRVDPFYAVKAAPYSPMISCLASMGAGFDCASQREVDLVLSSCGSANRIIFANTAKQISHITHARNNDVKMLVFDNEEEVTKIKQCYPTASLILRIEVDDSGSDWTLSERFGAPVEKAKTLLDHARKHDMNVTGISFHVGSSANDANGFATAIRDSRKLFDYADSIGMKFSVLDIGGGFQGVDKKVNEKVSLIVNETLNELFPEKLFPGLRIIAEPGRFFAATPFTLVTNVICKTVSAKESDVEVEYTINEGKYSNLICLSVGSPGEFEPHHLLKSKRTSLNSRVWGPTCDSLDVLYKNRPMPEMEVGEWLIFKNAGAYSFATAGTFNGFGTDIFYNIISRENAELFRRHLPKYSD